MLTDEQLITVWNSFDPPGWAEWQKRYLDFMAWVHVTPAAELSVESAQKRLWNARAITPAGRGDAVDVRSLLTAPEVVQVIVGLRMHTWPADTAARAAAIQAEFERILAMAVARDLKRRPSAKLHRLFGALLPRELTCVLGSDANRHVASLLLGAASERGVSGQVKVRARLRAVLGEEKDLTEHVRRSTFCWWLHENYERLVVGEMPPWKVAMPRARSTPRTVTETAANGPVAIFISYAPEDEALLIELENSLALMQRNGMIRTWHRGRINAGEDRAAAVAIQLKAAQVLLLLVSRDYLASDDCYDVEVARAIERHHTGQALVIPIILRACDWTGAPFRKIEVLPRGGKPIASWPNRDEAWAHVVQAIREATNKLGRATSSTAVSPPRLDTTEPFGDAWAIGSGNRNGRGPGPERGPSPKYPDDATRLLSEQLEDALARKARLGAIGASAAHLNREILNLKRQIRDGGQLRAGDSLGDGRYLLLEPVGRGGFAFVWKAFDRERNQTVGLKVMHSNLAGDPHRRERFFRGARIMAELEHPAVVRVFEQRGEDGGWHYFVMEFVAGDDLQRAILKNLLTPDRVASVILRVGEALAFAHAKGLVHRDVKPANILLDENGEPKLTDFDLVAAGYTTGGTRTGALGTFIYSAPECMHRPQDADARADIYGLGMTAMFCLHGAELPPIVMRAPERVLDGLRCNSAVKNVLRQAIAWEPVERPASASSFCEAFMRASRGELPPSSSNASMGEHPVDVTARAIDYVESKNVQLPMESGVVEEIDTGNRWGFVKPRFGERAFFRETDLNSPLQIDDLSIGDAVDFEIEEGGHRRRLAHNVRRSTSIVT
ncbi:protein kinase [Sorangium sp. So ce726]|uniref:protein kinase domain-containing protein n=1 Tax=Sorangium sp. So ce726 TaxID=3133319 RepID=UPI003F60EC1E